MKKKFSEMSQEEIRAMSDEEFKAVSPFEKRSCYDCRFCKSVLSNWCTNKNAIKARGTRIPGVIKCPYWEVDWGYVKPEYKTEENGYKPRFKLSKGVNLHFYTDILNFLGFSKD